MPIIEVTQSFSFAERGIEVLDYKVGELAEVSEECAEIAIAEGWAKQADKENASPARRGKKRIEPDPVVDEDFEKSRLGPAEQPAE